MNLRRTHRARGEGSLPFLIILLVIGGGIIWWLYAARQDAKKNIRLFAEDAAKHLAVGYDQKYLYFHLSPAGQAQLLPSWRDRFFEQLRSLGTPTQPIEMNGEVLFSSYFFDPHGTFMGQLKYPNTSAELEFEISRGMTTWQIDNLAVRWTPPPATPTPVPEPTATPAPTPPPEKAKRKTKR
jgi:hypothetical protein